MKKNNQKGSVLSIVEIIVVVILIAVGGVYYYSNKSVAPIVDDSINLPEPQLIGGDQDAHGCLPSAGYLWSDAKQACVRPWEENQATNPPANPVACTMEAKACPDGSYVGRVGPKCEFQACPTSTTPSITVISPNGGEIVKLGSKYTITWTAKNLKYANVVGIFLQNDSIPCTNKYFTDFCQKRFVIDDVDAYKGTYTWDTNSPLSGNPGPSTSVIAGTKYKILICGVEEDTCDSSDNYFTITN